MQVTITDDGRLQLIDNGTTSAPLTVEAVELLSNAIPAAQAVLVQVPLALALADVASGLSSGTANATVTVQGAVVSVTADNPTFLALAKALGVMPGMTTTSFTVGPVTVTKMGS